MELVFKLYCKSAKSILSSKEDFVSEEKKTIKKEVVENKKDTITKNKKKKLKQK